MKLKASVITALGLKCKGESKISPLTPSKINSSSKILLCDFYISGKLDKLDTFSFLEWTKTISRLLCMNVLTMTGFVSWTELFEAHRYRSVTSNVYDKKNI